MIVLVGLLGLAPFAGGCALLGIDPKAIKATHKEIRELEAKAADPKTPVEERERLRRRVVDLETGFKIPEALGPDSGH
ncbi:MAG: hypothetical protein A3K12_00860 [Candidatus Rokubacteria bacterium RIFCSPLOWO2_12_FULL_71_19]|nr:MAG: hypothetical protein A3K12_00860 [Candidatus Rokubacteria bacterium RIFCSPLOWO2_12_FULL_71_19]